MAISHRQIEAFYTFMQTGTVTAAAERLRVSQPAASKMLIGLERDLGLTLFARVKKRLMPTQDARLLYREVERLFASLRDIESFARDLRDLRAGELHVASAPSLGNTLLADSIADFAVRHPKTRIVLNVGTSVAQYVINQQVDLGFSMVQMQHPGMINTPLFHGRGVCVVPAGHRLAGRETVKAKDLEGEPFISFMRDSRMRHIIDAIFEQRQITRQLRYEVHTSVEACALVSRGLGVAIVEPLGVAYSVSPGLWIAHFEPAVDFTFNVMRPRFREPSRLAEAFLDNLLTVVRRVRDRGGHKGKKILLTLPARPEWRGGDMQLSSAR